MLQQTTTQAVNVPAIELMSSDGVRLLEVAPGVYVVVYTDCGFVRRPIFYSWAEAEANYERRVLEVQA